MEIGAEIWAVYKRAAAFAMAMPLVAAIPVLIEMARQLAMTTGSMSPPLIYVFSFLGTIGLVCVMVPALRWWRFEGDRARVWRLRWRVLWGVILMLAIQITDEFLFTAGGHLVAAVTGAPRVPIVFAAQLLWLLVSVLLYGWYVAMLTDDPLGLREVVRRIRPMWLYGYAIVLGSLIPVLTVTALLRMAGGAGDIGVVARVLTGSVMSAAIIVVTASAYFAIYRMARAAD